VSNKNPLAMMQIFESENIEIARFEKNHYNKVEFPKFKQSVRNDVYSKMILISVLKISQTIYKIGNQKIYP
jgi:hypothetical protein